MKPIGNILNLRWRAARFAITFALFASLGAAYASAQAPPYALMQDSTLTGTGNTINVTQLPVVTTSGISYYDLTILFDVSATGVLTVAAGYPQIVPAPEPIINGFVAGTYLGPKRPNRAYTGERAGCSTERGNSMVDHSCYRRCGLYLSIDGYLVRRGDKLEKQSVVLAH